MCKHKESMPWYSDIYFKCCNKIVNVDMHLEWLKLDKFPTKYFNALKRYFKTEDPKEILHKAFFNKNKTLLYCDKCDKVWLTDLKDGRTIKKIAYLSQDSYIKERDVENMVREIRKLPLEKRAILLNDIASVAFRNQEMRDKRFKGWGREDFNKLYKKYMKTSSEEFDVKDELLKVATIIEFE